MPHREQSSDRAARAGAGPKDCPKAGPKVALIGAGVCGLAIGWRLAEAGAEVAIFERGRAGRGATWASAGMLAAAAEAEPGEERLLEITRWSQALWPDFARALEAASGEAIGYRDEGTLVVAPSRDDAARLRATYDYQRGLGLPLDWLNPAEARRREPFLGANLAAAVFSAADHQVDNRRLAAALRAAVLTAGGRLHEETEVEALETAAGRVTGLQAGGRRHACDVVVLAAGAWSAELPGLPAAARPPVRPVKGQALALAMDPAAPLLSHVLWAPGIYMVPRAEGRLIVGATVEEKGFDARLTAGGVFSLLEAAWRAVPAIEELAIEEMWVGFRPTSRDDAPILGPTPVEGLLLATGHHRNGVLLAPATAAALSDYILTGALPAPARPFTLARFDGEAERAPPPAAASASHAPRANHATSATNATNAAHAAGGR
ncbi:MAG: glycine oxidase ThiO [Kiloniellales bacterium]|nr:glycine oxidase ThiO [Kiloniellales bacterium]